VASQRQRIGPGQARPSVPDDPLTCLIEIPKGSRNKYEWDEELAAIKFDRRLFSSVAYPTDYGFIPHTLALDGYPLDAMVAVAQPTFPGCLIEVKPVALLRINGVDGTDDKVLCVPLSDPSWEWLEDLDDLPKTLQDEITHFFSIYRGLDQDGVSVDGWYPRTTALEEIEASRGRHQDR
jgi:inorganic pyrophosphatase